MRIAIVGLILLTLLLAGGCDDDENDGPAGRSDEPAVDVPVVPVVGALPLTLFGTATVLLGLRARRRL